MSDITLKQAEPSDIESVLELHRRYQVDSIAPEDRADGFVTTSFTKDQLNQLIEKENGLFIAKLNDKVIAYVMAASWSFWKAWPIFDYLIKELPNLTYQGRQLTTDNSYQYGPICIDKYFRKSGLLESIFEFAKVEMSKSFPILVTFVNKNNERSFQAHKRKLGLDVIQEFEFNNNQYYNMVCLTR